MYTQFTGNLILWLELVGCWWTCAWRQQLSLSGTAQSRRITPQLCIVNDMSTEREGSACQTVMIGQDRKQPMHTGTIWDLNKHAATINLWLTTVASYLGTGMKGRRNGHIFQFPPKHGGCISDHWSAMCTRQSSSPMREKKRVEPLWWRWFFSCKLQSGGTSYGWSCQD
jgi:hypothetical protein